MPYLMLLVRSKRTQVGGYDLGCTLTSCPPPPTVSGRGIGCGRIPEYRLLMDQLVPASYLQLEDTVKKIAFNLRIQGKPPVLTYKELRYTQTHKLHFTHPQGTCNH